MEDLGIWAVLGCAGIGGIWLAFKKLSPLLFILFISFLGFLSVCGYKGWQALNDDPKIPSEEESFEPVPFAGIKENPLPVKAVPIDFSNWDYKVKDKKYWTYKTTGDWKWHEDFIASFREKSGWSYQKKGNFIIEVKHQGRSTLGQLNGAQSYEHTGGPLEISVNGQVCCCEEKLKLTKGVEGKNMAVLKEKLQEEVTKVMLEQQDYVISMIMECLR